MKNKIVIALLCLSPIIIKAQVGLMLEPTIGYGKTAIYNKEDTKGYTHRRGYINPLPMQNTFKANFGINIGASWQKEKTGLIGIYSGFGKMPFSQNFTGKISNNATDNSVVTASTALNYTSIPIHAKFRFGNSTKFVPTLTTGLNILLLQNYSDQYKAVLKSSVDSSTFTITQSVIDNRMEMKNPILTVANLKTWYYNKTVICTYLKLGIDYNINEKMNLNFGIDNIYSITDPENRNTIEGNISSQNGVYQVKPFEAFITKINSRGDADKRRTTHLIRTGINLSFTYKLFKNNN